MWSHKELSHFACTMMSAVESFTVDSMTRGYQVYKDVWSSYIGEVLYCHCDERSTEKAFWIMQALQ